MLLLQTGGERPRRSYLPTDSEQEAERKTNFMSLDPETKASEREGGKDIPLVVGCHNAISTMEVDKKVIRTF